MPAKQQTEITTFTAVTDSWFTPQWLADAAREVLGNIDLDPCSCPEANKIVRADRIFTEAENGLAHPWSGTVYCNPPSKRQRKDAPPIEKTMQAKLWAERLELLYGPRAVTAAILVVKSNMGYEWYEDIYKRRWVCHLRERPHFLLNGVDKGAAKKGVSVFYFGPKTLLFHDVFVEHGRVIPSERWIENRL